MRATQRSVFDWIDSHTTELSDWHQVIWHFAEPAFREYKSSAWYVEQLRAAGFDVEAGSGGMPTAFVATFRQGEGPTVATYAEYDAVPGNCQAASTRREPRGHLSRFAPGHTDPHSALGISALGGLLAAKDAMVRHGLQGTLKFFGEPAEKLRASKPIHAAKGYYDGLDAAVSFHPTYLLPLCNTTVWDTHCGVGYNYIYTFTCDDPQNWIASDKLSPIPQNHLAARAPGANDALIHFYQLNEGLRRSMLPATGLWSFNEAILVAGQATADNLPPHIAQIDFMVRTDSVEQAETISQVMDQNAEAAAKATHCQWKKTWVSKSRGGLPNHALARATYANLERAGAPRWNGDAIRIAQEIQRNLGIDAMAEPFLPVTEQLIDPEDCEVALRKQMPSWQKYMTSDDYTEYTWHCPTVRLYVARPMLKAPQGFVYPDWVANALGGIRETIDPMIVSASKTIGATLVDLLEDRDLLRAAQDEFAQRTEGGVGGRAWEAPMLDADFRVPHQYRWPEYVTTVRGEEWTIPYRDDE
ncbi:metal-dependent amidase/aminoacylase/carboxypeptidase [Burkholderia lata]|uniref:Metal-dependent amidase/aminoacylase/carboxypeptidase n=1 Tax=Burkholderia lata (strain ATCC 17760 / DSM 23089 / LMG 22485 / NCIMB 9086 / R18194 / 383) TaxID=482957 RepID=A0A6P2M313_BURL3|nr:amidohydrolase [Burkholderia lata]VWB74855.1 metal-dependent amidase/aminoacylase/carboxypeptidase [Burkholderia lata]